MTRRVFDYLSFRRDMEALAAERAARLGSDSDLKVIQAIFERMEAAQTPRDNAEEEARLDAQFHSAIIDASHNVVMLHMMRSMYDLLRQGVFYNRQVMFKQRTSRAALLDQHREINTALQARDPAGARARRRGASGLCPGRAGGPEARPAQTRPSPGNGCHGKPGATGTAVNPSNPDRGASAKEKPGPKGRVFMSATA